MSVRVEKHYYDEPYRLIKGDSIQFDMDNLTIVIKGLEGLAVGYRKIYDEDGSLIAIMPLLQNPHE